LLGELDKFEVVASHIVVNQLVTDYMEDSELAQLEDMANKDKGEGGILHKALAAARLTTARRNIQSKYLKDLRKAPEVQRLPDPEDSKKTNTRASKEPLVVLEVPLLPSEVTGPKAILEFSHYLIGKELKSTTSKSVGVEGERSKKARADEHDEEAKAANAPKVQKTKKKGPDMKAMADGALALVMADPELAKMIEDSPKLQGIVEEIKDNPMAAMQYMGDPEVGPFVQKAMAKLMGGGPGGKKKRKGKGAAGGGDPMAALAGLMGGMGGAGGAGGQPDLAKMMAGMGAGEL